MRHELSGQSLSAQNFIITLCHVSVLWDLLQAYTVLDTVCFVQCLALYSASDYPMMKLCAVMNSQINLRS